MIIYFLFFIFLWEVNENEGERTSSSVPLLRSQGSVGFSVHRWLSGLLRTA